MSRDTPAPPQAGSLFAAAFGPGRGRSDAAEQTTPLTRRERVQLLADWIESQADREDRLSRVRDENRRADELRLLLQHGIWKPFTTDGSEAELVMCSPTTFVYDQEDPVFPIAVLDVHSQGGITVFLS